MRYSASEKLEIIRTVEDSSLGIGRTLAQIGIPRSTFYRWYDAYQIAGFDGLEDSIPAPRAVWNKVPDERRQQLLELALDEPDLSPRELAVRFTEQHRYFICESTACGFLDGKQGMGDERMVTQPFHILARKPD